MPLNGYALFLYERRDQTPGLRGNRIPFTELTKRFDEEWRNLSQEEKRFYKDMAKERRSDEKLGPFKREARKSKAVQDREKEEEDSQCSLMKKDTMAHLDRLTQNSTIENVSFIIIDVNKWMEYKENDQACLIPAEISLVRFSLKNGLLHSQNALIHHGEIESGDWNAIESSSRNEHGIPMRYPKLISNFSHVAQKLEEFLDGEQLVYARPGESVPYALAALDWLEKNTLTKFSNVRVFPMDYLLVCLIKRLRPDLEEVELKEANEILVSNRITYDFAKDLSCQTFHQSVDGPNSQCSLARAKIVIFALCEAVCPLMNEKILLAKGRHTL